MHSINLIDLGDAVEETRQVAPIQLVPDYLFGWGWFV